MSMASHGTAQDLKYCLCADLLQPGERGGGHQHQDLRADSGQVWHTQALAQAPGAHRRKYNPPDLRGHSLTEYCRMTTSPSLILGPVFGNLEADFARTYVIGETSSLKGLIAQAAM